MVEGIPGWKTGFLALLILASPGRASIDVDLLVAAAEGGMTDEVKTMLGDAGARDDIDKKTTAGTTALIAAAGSGRSEVVKLLLEKGASPGVTNSFGSTALLVAAHAGYLEVVKLLTASDKDINHKNNEGWTAIAGAAANAHMDVVDWLLDHGGDPNSKHPVVGVTLLGISHVLKSIDLVKKCLAHGADPNAASNEQCTPLYTVCGGASNADLPAIPLAVAELLLQHGASVELRNKQGWSPLGVAARYRDPEFLELLLDHHGDANDRCVTADGKGYTLVMLALHQEDSVRAAAVIKLLASKGADLAAKGPSDRTALMLAMSLGKKDLVKLLKDLSAR